MPFRLQTFICQTLVFSKMLALVIIGWVCAQQIWKDLTVIEDAKNRIVITTKVAEHFVRLRNQVFLVSEKRATESDIIKSKEKIWANINRMKVLSAKEPARKTDFVSETEETRRARELQSLLDSIISMSNKLNDVDLHRADEARMAMRLDFENNFNPRLRTFITNSLSSDQALISNATASSFETVQFFVLIVILLAALTMLGHAASGYLHRSLVGPMHEIADSIERLSKNDNDVEIKTTSFSSEVTKVILNFNELARYLRTHTAEHSNLEGKYKARTDELTNANQKLKRLDTMRAQFLADVSHELRTPLTTIKGETEIRLRKEGNAEEDYRSTLSRVKVMSDQMSFLVDDLLFIARSEKDTISFQFKDSDLEGIVSSVVHNYEVLAKEKEISVVIEWPEEPLEISMDAFRLKQALNILLDNALKFSSRKTTINVKITATSQHAVICVRNKGIRIPPEDIPYVFERFYIGQNEQHPSNSSGLGLSIAKWIIEKHKGSIGLTSDTEGVTIVTIEIPRSQHAQTAEHSYEQTELQAAGE